MESMHFTNPSFYYIAYLQNTTFVWVMAHITQL